METKRRLVFGFSRTLCLLIAVASITGCCREPKFPTNHEELQATRHARQFFSMSYPVALSWHSLEYTPTGPVLSPLELQILLQSELAGLLSEDAIASALSTEEVRQWNLIDEGDDPIDWVRERLVVFNSSASQVWELALVDRRAPSAAMLAIVESLTASYTERARGEENARLAFLEAKQWRGQRSRLSQPVAAAYAAWAARVKSAAADLLSGESKLPLPEFARDQIENSDFRSLSRDEVVQSIHDKVAYWAKYKQPIIKLSQFGPAEFSEGR